MANRWFGTAVLGIAVASAFLLSSTWSAAQERGGERGGRKDAKVVMIGQKDLADVRAGDMVVLRGKAVDVQTDAVVVESAQVMTPNDGPEPPIFESFRRALGKEVPMLKLGRFAFYDAARGPDVALVIATGEQRIYANILLTIGVVPED